MVHDWAGVAVVPSSQPRHRPPGAEVGRSDGAGELARCQQYVFAELVVEVLKLDVLAPATTEHLSLSVLRDHSADTFGQERGGSRGRERGTGPDPDRLQELAAGLGWAGCFDVTFSGLRGDIRIRRTLAVSMVGIAHDDSSK